MQLLDDFVKKAKEKKAKIVLPETTDERIIWAAKKIVDAEVATVILIGNRELLIPQFSEQEKTNIIFYDPATDNEKVNQLASILFEKRKHKGMTIEKAKEEVINKTHYFGALLVETGEADGMVCGAVCTTGETIRSIVHCVGLKQGSKLISSFFIMATPQKEYGSDGVLFFADCAVNPCPDADQLASIAIDTACSYRQMMDDTPTVAMLSFSTKGSANHPLADKVILATEKVKQERPDILVDGELQLDSAIVPSIASKKAPDSNVAGKANCLIFPDLQAGNIGYKLTERLAKAIAVGPIIQGAKKPINDLSRGCSADDIFYTTAMTVLQVDN